MHTTTDPPAPRHRVAPSCCGQSFGLSPWFGDRSRGFRFVGSTIIYAHMQATGMVNDHLITCPRHKEVARLSKKQANHI